MDEVVEKALFTYKSYHQMNALSKRLSAAIKKYQPILEAVEEKTVTLKPNPSKWSKIEILGHLIDSAANNHQRFVRIQAMDDLIFDGYDQDEWVIVQSYQQKKWEDVISLWSGYNNHLAYVIANIPAAVITADRTKHNLDKIAFKTVPSTESTTLGYFIKDYIDHLEHHMRQILEA